MKWVMRIGVILVAVVGILIAGILLLPGDRIAAIATDQIRAQTGRELAVSGDVRLTLWPVLGVETGPMTLSNPEWVGSEPMFSAQKVSIGIAAPALLRGEVRVKRIIADDPVLRLVESQGRRNWEFGAPSGGGTVSQSNSMADGVTTPSSITLENLKLHNARLVYKDDGGTAFDLSQVEMTARWPSETAPFDLQLRVQPGSQPVDLTVRLHDFGAFSSGAITRLELSAITDEGEIQYDGQISQLGEAAGRVSVKASDTQRVLVALGHPGLSLPNGLGRAANIDAQMTYTRDGRLSLREMQLALGANHLSGDVDLVLAGKPKFTAQLSANDLDFTAATSSAQGGGSVAAAQNADGWSKEAIDASGLALADGVVSLSARSIKTSFVSLGATNLSLSVERSRSVLKMAPVSVFSGTLNGQLVANNRNGLSVGGKLRAEGIEMQQALMLLGGVDRLSGKATASLEFLGVGASEHAIVNSLSGQGRVQMGRGIISGFDLDRLMESGQAGGGTTVFNSLGASFTMAKGDLLNQDLLLQLDNYRADGAGRIGLGARDIDYVFTPVALRANAGKGLAVPVRIVGPWADPSIKPDLSQIIEAAADVRIDEVEDQATGKLLEKLSEELDQTVTEDQDVEELIKGRIEDEAKKGLLKLFGVD
jgi:AsmA protein